MEKLEQQPFQTEALDMYGTDLTKRAIEGKLDPVIGRLKQMDRIMQILCKKKKNNACLVGDPGVGKTVIAQGLAQRITDTVVPKKLLNKKVFSIDMERLIAGASDRGEFELRMLNIVNEVKASNGAIILFIDDLHTLSRPGQPLNAANILKRLLQKCIGATTLEEYRRYIEKDSALKTSFSLVNVPEPTVEETLEILQGLCKRYEDYHNVKYTDSALAAAARLSKKYVSDGLLPGKAIDLIDEAGGRLQISGSSETLVVTETEIQKEISLMTGIPVENVSVDESTQLLKMEQMLGRHIVGQEEAVSAVSRAIRRARVGLRNPNRPIASFIFAGPTGVGKTELAKLVATEYFGSKEAMVRLDMSEFMEKHTVSKLFGSPPGYIGHDDSGQLTEAVRRRPHNLVVIDEIEKGHSDVLNAFHPILDDARLTDNRGRTVDFKNTIIIMTSNVGGHLTGTSDNMKKLVGEELKKVFKPEFLNRIDEVIVFERLDATDAMQEN